MLPLGIQHLTPHQFQPLRTFVDTLVITSYTPTPLDIAVPYAASEWIAKYLANEVLTQYAGRSTHLAAGATLMNSVTPDKVSVVRDVWLHRVDYVIWLTDRTLTTESWSPSGDVHMVVLDWWQWLNKRVPEQRISDAWMFLALACPEYWNSPERRQVGLHEEQSVAMATEGRKLLDALGEWITGHLLALWETSPDDNGDRGEH